MPFSPLGSVTLKTGETLRLSCVLGPEPDHAGRVAPFLGHKQPTWRWHIERALREPLDGLETRFYLGEIGGRIVGNVCTFESNGVGILGHVFTTPDQRHKGVAGSVMAAALEDFHARGGTILTLGTAYGSNAYRIYKGLGFVSVTPGSGEMILGLAPEEMGSLFTPGAGAVHPARWGDGPRLSLLFLQPEGPYLRNLAYERFGSSNMEGPGLQLQWDRDHGDLCGAWVMANEAGRAVGFASATAAPQWPGPTLQLDLFIHPRFEAEAGALLEPLAGRSERLIMFMETGHTAIEAALASAGFEREGTLRGHLNAPDGPRDIAVWGRPPA